MAIQNKPGENFDTGFGLNDSLELSFQHDYDSTQPWIFKIIVIGDSNVGKTCLTYRFCGGAFVDNPEATIGVDFREKKLQLDGETIKVRGLKTNTHTHTSMLFPSAVGTFHFIPLAAFVCGQERENDRSLFW